MKNNLVIFITLFFILILFTGCDAYYMQSAVKNNDIKLCDKIGYWRLSCYRKLFSQSTNISLCEEISFNDAKEECYATVGKNTANASACEKISDEYLRIDCYIGVAGITGDVSLCTKFSSQVVTNAYICYGAVARAKNNASYCNLIDDSGAGFRDSCLVDIAIRRNESPLFCEENRSPYNKAMCYRSYGMVAKNLSICQSLESPGLRDVCYLGSKESIEKQDLSFCDELGSEDDKNMCISFIAQKRENSSLCDIITENTLPSSTSKGDCYYYFARKFNDISFCERISHYLKKKDCYWDVAKATMDESICEKINDSEIKEDCYWALISEEQLRK